MNGHFTELKFYSKIPRPIYQALNTMSDTQSGLGDPLESLINVYIANRPPLDEYDSIDGVIPMKPSEIYSIAQLTGNHWRKVFNVYAKFIYELWDMSNFKDWQSYRDESLLQTGSKVRLLFSKPCLDETNKIHIVMGKQYAEKLGLSELSNEGMIRLDKDFAIDRNKGLIVCPYFDYRQLSNEKITRLVKMVQELHQKSNS